jgi:phosphopantothenoylcysteine decarboxylase/phosphopantothenate--cysteine ligase
MPLTGKNIVLGVSGSIAAYKAADIASQLGHLGANVHVILTPHAAQFIGAATFRALTKNPVLSDLFEEPHDRQIAHIQLAQEADLILVAPATANVLAKMAHGIADDLLTTVLLAATAPILVAPAMNSVMLDHPATQANLQTLRERGVEFVDPAYGVLACKTEGWGKLAEVATIMQGAVDKLSRSRDLEGVSVLVTAGATREPLDPVRFLSNRSSGKMGYAVAAAALARGAKVTLVSGHTAIAPPAGVELVPVGTTEEMLAATQSQFADCDLLIATAAPADYTPVTVETKKIKKDAARPELTLHLRETPDILAALAPQKKNQIVVGFAAETDNVVEYATEKIRRKRLDLIVANDVSAEGAGFEVDTNIVTLVWPDGRCEHLSKMPKRQVADRLLDAVVGLVKR